MHHALHDIAVHPHQVGGRVGLLGENVDGREVAIVDLVDMIAAQRADARKDHAIDDIFLLHHRLQPGQQVNLELHPHHHDALELPAHRIGIGHGGIIGLVVRRVRRGAHDLLRRRGRGQQQEG